MPRLTIAATIIALAISLITRVAGGYSSSHTEIPYGYHINKADTSAWFLGVEHAVRLVRECDSDDKRGLRLLEVRARETNIRNRIGDSAADAYVSGFEHGLRTESDSLARVVLD